MLCAAALSAMAFSASAALQYSLQTGTGEAWFSVDSRQTVYVDVKKNNIICSSAGNSKESPRIFCPGTAFQTGT